MFTCRDKSNVNKKTAAGGEEKGSFDKCLMGKKLIRREAASFDFTSTTDSVGQDRAGGEGGMIGLHWTVTLDGYQPVSILCFISVLKQGAEEFLQQVARDIICMLPKLRHRDSVTKMG